MEDKQKPNEDVDDDDNRDALDTLLNQFIRRRYVLTRTDESVGDYSE